MKKALITGTSGQDGSYLAELLLKKNYEVIGMVRRSSVCNLGRLNNLINHRNMSLVEGEISDPLSVYSIVESVQADEIYNLAAMSHVQTSFAQPSYTFDVCAKGPLNMLEAIRKYSSHSRFYQASTSELFGKNFTRAPQTAFKYQDENTPFAPQSPYACAKLAAHDLVRIYRDGYGLHASAGILFNHGSERRGEKFVTRKITMWMADFYHWKQRLLIDKERTRNDIDNIISTDHNQLPFAKLRLGNLDSFRDWGHAEDYVYAMWLMMQQDDPDDYVIASGETHTVREFLTAAFNEINVTDFEPYIMTDPAFYRPSEVDFLRGIPDKAKNILGWEPKVSFKDLVRRMVRSDINGSQKKTPTYSTDRQTAVSTT